MTHELTQPTKEMLDAGVEDLLQQVPGLEDDLGDDELQDVVCFVWQAMLAKAPKAPKAPQAPQAPQVTADEIAEQQGVDPAITDAYMQGCHDAEARRAQEARVTNEHLHSKATDIIESVYAELHSDSPDHSWIAKIMTRESAIDALYAALTRSPE